MINSVKDDGTLWITINRPQKLNAATTEMLKELLHLLDTAATDSSLRAIVISGAGEKAFCAGADITEENALSPVEHISFCYFGQKICDAIENNPLPVIAAINGYCLGGGFELAMACDFRIAVPQASMGLPELNLGALPGWGGMLRLIKAVGTSTAKEIILLRKTLSAEDALKKGLINEIVDREQLHLKCQEYVSALAEVPPFVLGAAKKILGWNSAGDAYFYQAEALANGVTRSLESRRLREAKFVKK